MYVQQIISNCAELTMWRKDHWMTVWLAIEHLSRLNDVKQGPVPSIAKCKEIGSHNDVECRAVENQTSIDKSAMHTGE